MSREVISEELVHYAAEPMVFDRARTYRQSEPQPFGKPNGLWVSVAGEDDWAAWCHSEGYGLHEVVHRVVLRPHARILWISDPDILDGFHAAYAVETGYTDAVETEYERLLAGYGLRSAYGRLALRDAYGRLGQRYWPLDWRRVAGDYDGLIIAPYLRSRRVDGPQWYYGWDCASGCIWSADAVVSVDVMNVSAELGGDG